MTRAPSLAPVWAKPRLPRPAVDCFVLILFLITKALGRLSEMPPKVSAPRIPRGAVLRLVACTSPTSWRRFTPRCGTFLALRALLYLCSPVFRLSFRFSGVYSRGPFFATEYAAEGICVTRSVAGNRHPFYRNLDLKRRSIPPKVKAFSSN